MSIQSNNLGNSVFVRLNPNILLEYTYSTSPHNKITAQTGTNDAVGNFIVFKNSHLGDTNFVVNTTTTSNTNNTRTHQVLPISITEFVRNEDTIPIPYSVVDSSNISTDYLGNSITGMPNPIDVVYDRVRLHLASGWNFEGNEGIIIYLQAQEKSLDWTTLVALVHERTESWFELNPRAFTFGETYFDTYIEFLVPSIQELIQEYENAPLSVKSDTFASRFSTDGKGLRSNAPFSVGVKYINRKFKENGYTHFETGETYATRFNQNDEFSNLFAEIVASPVGDYFEYQMKNGEDTIEDLIFALNNLAGNDYIIIHRINIYEQVGQSEILTRSFSEAQTSNFNLPMEFRPVLKYAETSPAFTIDYEVTLFNRGTVGRSINRKGSVTCLDCKKYGKKLMTIPITPASPFKVYNKVVDGTVVNVQNNLTSPSVTKFIPTFFEREFITTASQSVKIDSTGKITSTDSTSNKDIKGQSQSEILITPFDNFIKFNIYNVKDDVAVPLNLNFNSVFNIVFRNNMNSNVYIVSEILTTDDLNTGTLLFKIPKETSEKILNFTDKSFHIVSKDSNTGIESSLYTGRWLNETELKIKNDAALAAKTTNTSSTNSTTNNTNTTNQSTVTATTVVLSNDQTSSPKTSALKKINANTGVQNKLEGHDKDLQDAFISLSVPNIAVSNVALSEGISIRKNISKK